MRFAMSAALLGLGLFMLGDLPAQSSGRCGSRSAVVLGSVRARGPHNAGWGTCAPRFFTNGGDATGQVVQIRWTSWGQGIARGRGLTARNGPNGGVLPSIFPIYLRAFDLGRCGTAGPRAYRRLQYRDSDRLGRPSGPWRDWAYWRKGGSICRSY